MKLRIKDICKEKGVSISELAKRLNVTRSTVTNTITNNPTLSTLTDIANALRIDFFDLFEKEEGVYGFVEVKGKIFKITNRKDLEDLLKEFPNESNSLDEPSS